MLLGWCVLVVYVIKRGLALTTNYKNKSYNLTLKNVHTMLQLNQIKLKFVEIRILVVTNIIYKTYLNFHAMGHDCM